MKLKFQRGVRINGTSYRTGDVAEIEDARMAHWLIRAHKAVREPVSAAAPVPEPQATPEASEPEQAAAPTPPPAPKGLTTKGLGGAKGKRRTT